MSQSQSISLQQGGLGMNAGHPHSPMQGQNGPMQGQNGPMGHSQNNMQQGSLLSHSGPMSNHNNNSQHSSFPSLDNSSSFSQVADFNLDFLDNMPSNDTTAQELLKSLDHSFLNDIL